MKKETTKLKKEHHYTEQELEGIARTPTAKPGSHLASCNLCRQKFEFFSRFYREYEQELAQPVAPHVQKLADTLGFERTLILHPFRAQVDIRSLGAGKTMLQLAAQTTSHESLYQMSVATFAIESARVLARVVKDRASNKFRIYILAEDPEMSRHVLVGVKTKDGEPVLIPTNAAGIALLPSTEPRDWTLSTVVVVTPVASFHLPDGLTGKPTLVREGLSVSTKTAKDLVSIGISSSPDDPVGRVMAVLENGSAVIKQCEEHRVSFSPDEAKRMRELRLFP